MDPWIELQAERIAGTAQDDLRALVAVSSPSGDGAAAEQCTALVLRWLPEHARVERPACSSPGHAPDLLARVAGTGSARVLLLGHVDTVIPHASHRPLHAEGDRLFGSGSLDMKGGDILALGVLRALSEGRRDAFAEVALLLVCDEEWRTHEFAHVEAFAGFDACLCFEAGELDREGHECVVVRRKAAGTIRVLATGRSAHSGSRPDEGRNALLALAHAAQIVAAQHDPLGPHRLTAVPTVLRSGDALNVVPAHGELLCDVRADDLSALDAVISAIPAEIGGVSLAVENLRAWPGMDSAAATAPLLLRASAALGRPIRPAARGGASDASHFAATIPLTIDGLGPLGADAHHPDEHVLTASLRTRAEVALAIADSVLDEVGRVG